MHRTARVDGRNGCAMQVVRVLLCLFGMGMLASLLFWCLKIYNYDSDDPNAASASKY